MANPVLGTILTEQNQGFETKKELFVKLEEELERPVISFYTSFTYPVMLEDADVAMLEDILRTIVCRKGLLLW